MVTLIIVAILLTSLTFIYTSTSSSPVDGHGISRDDTHASILGHGPEAVYGQLYSESQWAMQRGEDAKKITRAKELYLKRYPIRYFNNAIPGRAVNIPALENLATCVASNTCERGQEKIVILSSFHFENALNGHTSGEDIWASSVLETLTALNYTLLYTTHAMETLTLYQSLSDRVHNIIWEGTELDKCVKRTKDTWESTEHVEGPGTWQQEDGRFGCIKRPGYEDGIPLGKSFTFHFWENPRHPLGQQFTLAPEDYAGWNGGAGNYFLGYSLETRCRKVSLPAKRQHQGLVLGKRLDYFSDNTFAWADVLNSTINAMPPATDNETGQIMPFDLVATSGRAGDIPETLLNGKIRNLGPKSQDEWNQVLGSSKFLLGIGNPVLSPSPYDALCFGVPFINPIFSWDPKDPSDWTKWRTQHQALREVGAPYVYHVQKGNARQLKRAFRSVLENPIESYIPHSMRRESVMERTKALVETDWKAETEKAVNTLYTAQGIEFPYLL
ncbi:hypothetical protein IAR50_004177 [Cryptococcus sp. DSM 104548]